MKQYNESIKGKLFNYFRQRLNIKMSTKGWWRCNCPLCGGKYSFGIHMEEYKAHCFKCEEYIDTIKTLMVVEGFETRSEAYKFLAIQQEYEYFESYTREKKVYKKVELPEGYQLISSGTNIIAKSARHYITKRGFKVDSLAMKGVGYCTKGEYQGYIIFPYFRKGELVYYQGRLFQGAGPKMKNPPDTQFGIGKSQVVYNLDAYYIYDKVYTVESITNALTIGDNAGSLNGKSISVQQLSSIIMAPCTTNIIILDPDAWRNAIELGMQLAHYKKIKVVKLPDEVDVNDLGRNKTLKFVKATPYQKYMDLFRLKNEKSTEHTHYGRGPYQNSGRD
jgi:hypothetical protein